eukprot:403357518
MMIGEGMMLSRAGKFTEEIHMILKNKDEILSGGGSPKRLIKSQSSNKIQQHQDKEKEAKLMKQINFFQQDAQNGKDKGKDKKLAKSQSQRTLDKNGKNSWSFNTISREHYFTVHKIKYPIPPCGAYNINYEQVDRRFKPMQWTHQENRTRVVKEIVEPDMRLIELQKDQNGFLDYKRKNARLDFTKMQASHPHDKRFEPYNYFPGIYSKTATQPVISFTKTLPRDDKLQKVNLTPSNYTVNFEFLMPKLSKQLIPFQKIPERKPIDNINKAVTNDSTVYDNIDKYYQRFSQFKKVPSIDLQKQYKRGSDSPESKLPAFMEGVHDRISLNTISQKMLETNYFSEGHFQSVVSSFEPRKTYRVSQSTFGSPMSKSQMKFNPRLIAFGEAGSLMESQRLSRVGSQKDGVTLNSLLKSNGTFNKQQHQQSAQNL